MIAVIATPADWDESIALLKDNPGVPPNEICVLTVALRRLGHVNPKVYNTYVLIGLPGDEVEYTLDTEGYHLTMLYDSFGQGLSEERLNENVLVTLTKASNNE